MRLTENFLLREFTSLKKNQMSDEMFIMIYHLASGILQPFRNILAEKTKDSKKANMIITSGVRTLEDVDRLIREGYNPSETSDHYYNQCVPIRNKRKIKQFGTNIFNFGVGAVDFVCPCLNMLDVYNTLYDEYLKNGIIDVGQFIYEKGKYSDWIHVSNPYELKFSDLFVKQYLNKEKFLISENNGKSYKKF